MTAIANEYPDDIRGLCEGLEGFLQKEVVDRHEVNANLLENERLKYAEDGRYSAPVIALMKEVRMASAKAGYYTMSAPRSMGGLDMGYLAYFAACECVARVCGGKYWLGNLVIAHWASGPSRVLQKLSPRSQEEVLPGLVSGEKTMCFGLSEPGAGSDATMIKTRAERDGDGWRLSGGKIWTTHSPTADYAIVFAVTDQEKAKARNGGISAFLIPTDSEGLTIEQIIRMWGSIGGNEAMLHFDNVRIEPHQLVGELDEGFKTAMRGVSIGRIYNCGRSVGLGRWGLDRAFEFIKVRETFGRPIAEYQGVTFPLAQAATEIHAAHLMARNVAMLLDSGISARKELAMAKGFAVQAAAKALDTVIQTHGAIGMTNEMHLTEAYVMARLVNIADGTNEILKRTVVKEMLSGDMDL